MRIGCVVCMFLVLAVSACGAEGPQEWSDPAERDVAAEVESSEVRTEQVLQGADGCASFADTNDAQVAAGRARVESTTFLFFSFNVYYATGSNDLMGTSGTAQSTLYETSPGVYSVTNAGCASSPGGDGPRPTLLPTATNCPAFGNGTTVRFGRMNVVTYMDPQAKTKPAPGGPLILYYHATLSSPAEVLLGFGLQNINEVTRMGGVVAAFTSTPCPGCATTDDFYWFVEDNEIQDQVVACAIQQANIDTRHIHALGWSAGALHAVYVGLSRSNYMASVVSYSGGLSPWPLQNIAQDPNNHISALLTYGATDWVVIDFQAQSRAYYNSFASRGYYTMMCPHGRGHEIDLGVAPQSLRFFMDHPYKVSPEPYAAGVPPVFPGYCRSAL